MKIEKYVNRLGIYEPYQSGGGKQKNAETEQDYHYYYSTPNYMSFMDAMYLTKHGKVNQDGAFELSKKGGRLQNYLKTLNQWANRLYQYNILSPNQIIKNEESHKNAEKALQMQFNIFSSKTYGGNKTNKLFMKKGGRKLVSKKNNKEAFSLIVKGNDEFKPFFYSLV